MRTRRFAGTLLAAALAAGCAFGAAALAAPLAADALPAATPTPLTKENSVLFLPENYEQYLSLQSPSSVAIGEHHIAIADGKTLYLYDRDKESYSKQDVPEANETITKIGFAGDRLFVSTRAAGGNHCYEYNYTKKTFDTFTFNCSTFCISDNTLYIASVGGEQTTIASYVISDLESTHPTPHTLGTLDVNATPSMTKLGGTLYCTVNGIAYYNNLSIGEEFNERKCFYLSSTASDAHNVQSTCAHENAFYYTAEGGLYRADFSMTDNTAKKATCVLAGEKFGALTSYGGSLYCIREKSVLRFDPDGTDYKIADYEISSASASVGRLSDAKDVARAGSLVVIADAGNRRVTVYDGKTGQYSVLAPEEADFSPSLVATDGSVIAAACGNKVYVCDYGDECFDEPTTADIGTIKGLACVNGNVYYITEYGYGKIEEVDRGLISRLEGNLEALAADGNGILYVVDSIGHVRYFYEDEFIDTAIMSGGDTGLTLPVPISSLQADCEGNLYFIRDKEIWKNETPYFKVDNSHFVYGDESEPISFALGFEDDKVFLLYGNYIIKTAPGTLDIPHWSQRNSYGNQQDIFPPDNRKNKN